MTGELQARGMAASRNHFELLGLEATFAVPAEVLDRSFLQMKLADLPGGPAPAAAEQGAAPTPAEPAQPAKPGEGA